jgi:hypothetical protein
MSHLQLIAYWIGINVVLGVFGPLIVGYLFADFAVHPPKLTLRKFYSKGELAFASLLIALTVIVDVLKSHFAAQTAELLVVSLGFFAFIAAQTWAVPLCIDLVKKDEVRWSKVWRRSWLVALMIFSIGTVTEILLELASQG